MRREILLSGLLFGAAACGSSCEHRGVSSRDRLAEPEPLDAEQLATRLWPAGSKGAWRPISEQKQLALEALLVILLDNAAQGELPIHERRRANKLAAVAGLELSALERGQVRLWVAAEPSDDVRGRGAYVIRRGPASPLLLSIPHTFHDIGTGDIGLALALGEGPIVPRALFVNTVHRHRQLDGSKKELRHNPADSAHEPAHPLARATRRALEQGIVTVVQLHGFTLRPHDPAVILSSGTAQPSAYVVALAGSLRAAMPEFPIGVYGLDTTYMGGLENVQGEHARGLARCFVHVEIGRELRDRLVEDAALREQFGRGVLVMPEETGVCR